MTTAPRTDPVAALHALLAHEFSRQAPDLRSWSTCHRLESGRPLDFDAFPFQRELYEAFGDKKIPSVDVMKSAQCGISAAGVSLALYATDQWAASVLYVLPTEALAETLSDTRVKRSIEDSPYLSSRVTATDSKGVKRIGESYLYFTGSTTERQALSVPADVLVLDEYDRLDQRQIPKFRKRLSSALSLKLERRFSNPSFPESGIHGLYFASDQRHWLIRCESCSHEASITYDQHDGGHHVSEERSTRICGRCRRGLAPAVIGRGRWAAARPDAGRRGYHVSKLIVPDEDIGALVTEHRKRDEDSLSAHYNFDLGLPYSPKGGSLDRPTVMACRRDVSCQSSYDGADWVTAGVDVGAVLHVRISRRLERSGRLVPLFLGEIPDFTELAQLWRGFHVNFGIVDERPEERQARSFMESFRGRVMLLRWSGDEQRDPVIEDRASGIVSARRTGACDRLVAAYQEQKKLLPRDLPRPYLSQITAPHRVVETNARGQKIGRYVSERADHYFFAELHELIASEMRRARPASARIEGPPTIREEILRTRWGR
jgi:phage terminase large subunit GpA